MASISLKSVIYFVVVVIFVGFTMLLMQGMLPRTGLSGEEGPATDKHSGQSGADGLPYVVSDKRKTKTTTESGNSPTHDLYAEPLPQNLDVLAKDVDILEKRVTVMGYTTFFREAFPPKSVDPTRQIVLLLHGMSFTSNTWLELGTIGLVAAMGCRVVAVDLPGYGDTGGKSLQSKQRGEYLAQLLSLLNLDLAVVVSPSMSGSFSLPLLMDGQDELGGYVPVAPVFTNDFTEEQYRSVKTPTLIIYGELDKTLGEESARNLRKIPNSYLYKLPRAEHAAYMDRPDLFHQLLYNFLLVLNQQDTA